MSRSLEAAIVIPCTLILITTGFARQIPILKELREEASSLVSISAEEVHPPSLYARTERERGRCRLEANPQKLLEAVRLAEDLIFYEKRTKELQPAPALPQLPGFPALPEPDTEEHGPPYREVPQIPPYTP